MYDQQKDIERILISQEELEQICDRLARELTDRYRESGRELIFVAILKGAMVFATDLLRHIPLACSLECMKVSSYGASTESSGEILLQLDLLRDVTDADVVILEDIIDSGRTLQALTKLLSSRGAHSVTCCALLDKPDRRAVDFCAEYVGKVIPDLFVVGYGLDYNERYRNLPYVGILLPAVYQNK